ncbi:Multidrug resistance-associated protein 6, partial [Coemansia nantahalensis]
MAQGLAWVVGAVVAQVACLWGRWAPAHVSLGILLHLVPALVRAAAAVLCLHRSPLLTSSGKPSAATAPGIHAAQPLLAQASIAVALALAVGANAQAPASHLLLPLLPLALVDVWLLAKAARPHAGRARDSGAVGVAAPRSWLAVATYHWVFRYLCSERRQRRHRSGSEAGLDARLPQLPRALHPAHGLTRFATQWQREVASGRGSLAHALWRSFARELIVCSALRLVVLAKEIMEPVVVARILQALGEPPSTGALAGHGRAVALYVGVACIGGLVEQHHIDMRDRTELSMRMALTCAVHQAHTGVSGAHVSVADLGLAARARGTDLYSCGIHSTQQLAAHIAKLTTVLWVPLRLAAGLWMFYGQVGWAAAPGVAAVLLYPPLRARLLKRAVDARARVAAASSERASLLAQLLDNAVPVRMLGWGPVLVARIRALRERAELLPAIESSAAYASLYSVRMACRTGGPLASLLIYSIAARYFASRSSGGDASSGTPAVSAERVFMVQAILCELFPVLIDAPHALDDWWAAQQPYAQIQAVLRCAAQRTPRSSEPAKSADSDDDGAVAVRITNAAFAWPVAATDGDCAAAADPPFTLNVADLVVREQQLVAVVGAVGSGKSSLLLAILGEMGAAASADGGCVVRGRIAYVPQQPWIMSGTVRENIVFGSAFDEPWFNRVVDMCELRHDVDRWPLGALTVVGSNGMALSGGQRMRVALARAVYSRAAVYLLDDILHAVDVHVARRLVHGLLAGPTALLRGTARVVVTSDPLMLRAAAATYEANAGRIARRAQADV